MRPTIEKMEEWYRDLNNRYFDGLLVPSPDFEITQREDVVGMFSIIRLKNGLTTGEKISLNDSKTSTETFFKGVMLHEMIHYYVFRDCGKVGHCEEFNEKCKDVVKSMQYYGYDKSYLHIDGVARVPDMFDRTNSLYMKRWKQNRIIGRARDGSKEFFFAVLEDTDLTWIKEKFNDCVCFYNVNMDENEVFVDLPTTGKGKKILRGKWLKVDSLVWNLYNDTLYDAFARDLLW